MRGDPKAIDLRQVRSFVVLAEELHFGKAATRLSLAQPSLTRQIQLLEAYMGVALFHRTQREVHLTPAGQTFLEQARITLEQHDRSIEAAQNVAEKHTDVLTIGFEPCAAFHGLPQVVQEFGRRHPKVKLISYQLNAPEQEEALRRGRIDAGFLHPPVADPKLIFEKVLEERFIAVLPASHPLAHQRRIRLSDLAAERFILFPRKLAPGCFDIIMNLCRCAGFAPRTQHETSEMTLCLSLVAAGSGITLAPVCVRRWKVPGIVYRELDSDSAIVESGIIRNSGGPSIALKHFLGVWQNHLSKSGGLSKRRPGARSGVTARNGK